MSYQVPVVVTYEYRHVVWVDAPDLEDGQPLADAMKDAKRCIENEPYEYTRDNETMISADYDTDVPNELYLRFYVYGYGDHPGGGKQHDAHVHTHRYMQQVQRRERERAECTAAGHPNLERPISDGRRYCPGCGRYLKLVGVEP